MDVTLDRQSEPSPALCDEPVHGPIPRARRPTRALAAAALAVMILAGGLAARSATNGTDSEPPPSARRFTTSRAEQLASLEAAARAQPGDVQRWHTLAQGLLAELSRTGDPATASRVALVLDQAASLAPDAPATLLGQATLAVTLHRFDDALALTDRLLNNNPLHAGALAIAVDALVELGRYDDATVMLQRLADRQPSIAALTRVSYLRELHGDLDGALVAMTQAEVAANGSLGASSPDAGIAVAAVVALQGDLLWASGRASEAAQRYRKALDVDPGLPIAEVGLARTEAATGDLAMAIARLEALVQRYPLPAATTLLFELQSLAGQRTEAKATSDLVRATAVLAQAGGAVIDGELAAFNVEHGNDPTAALQGAEAAYLARPTTAAADVVAVARLRAGQIPGAQQAMSDALRLGTKDAAAHAHAAAISHASGDDLGARQHLIQAFETNPWFSFAPTRRAELSALARRLGVSPPVQWTAS